MIVPFFALPLVLAPSPDITPEKTIQFFVEAVNEQDAAAMGRQVLGATPGDFPFPNSFPKCKAHFKDATVEGDEATINVDTEFSDAKADSKFHETVHLRRINGDWRIVPASSLDGTKPPQPLSMLALAITKRDTFAFAKKAAKKTIDLSNVKQIALAAMMYAADHDDRLPAAKNFKAAVMPYLRNAEIFTAPNAPKGAVSYFLDPRLSGMVTTSISRPAETAMIIEGTPAKTAFPWEGKTPLGYADGHVKMVDAPLVYKARTIKLK